MLERRNRMSGKVRVRQLRVCSGCVCVSVFGRVGGIKKPISFGLVSLHNSTLGYDCVHLHRMI